MRYSDFKSTLLEYKREPTARSFGSKIIARVRTAAGHDLGDDLMTAKTIIQIAYDPQAFSHWGIGRKKMQFGGQWVSVGLDNAKEVLQQITPSVINSVLELLERGDPTQNKVFVPWLAREWSNGNIKRFEDIGSRLRPLMQDFIAYKNKRDFPAQAKDIMRLTAHDFETVMTEYQPPEAEQRARGTASTLLDNSEVRVIRPEDEEAACYYGRGTRWCTASTRGNNMFKHYNDDGHLYIVLPKQPKYEGEKYQLHFDSEQFMDEGDSPIELDDLILTRFPSLEEFFKKQEPIIASYIMFADDKTLEGLWQLIGEFANDYANDIYSDWEANDDGFHRWQMEYAQEKGYMTADGDVDWDKVHDDAHFGYDQYNDDAQRMLGEVYEISQWKYFDIRNFLERMNIDNEHFGTPTLTDLEDVFAAACEHEVKSHSDVIAERIQQKIWIRTDFNGAEQYKKDGGRILGKVGEYTVGLVKEYTGRTNEAIDRRGFLRGMLGAGAAAAGLSATDAEAAKKKPSAPKQFQPPKKITPEESRGGHSPQELRAYVEAMAQKYLPTNQVAQFVGQIAHETANFTSMIEQNPEKNIRHYAKPGNPLGNKNLQDAWKYIGRGFLQITGRYNYKHFGDRIRPGLGDELLANPNLAMRKDYAIALAVMFWRERVAPKIQAGASQHDINKSINGRKPKGAESRDRLIKQASASISNRKV
jgi:predicted chitinase